MEIGKNIRQIRESSHLSQQELADLVHVTRQTVSNWENEKSYPDLETLIRISDHFSVSLDSMLKTDMELVRRIDMQKALARRRKRTLIAAVMIFILFAGAAMFFYAPGSTRSCDVRKIRSSFHTEQEYHAAVRAVSRSFLAYRGCTMTEIRYAGDARVREEARYEKRQKENVIVLVSTFHTDRRGADGSFEPDETVTDWTWTLVRSNSGGWKVRNSGYA